MTTGDVIQTHSLKVVTSEKIGGSKVISTLGTWYGGVVMGVLLPFLSTGDQHYIP